MQANLIHRIRRWIGPFQCLGFCLGFVIADGLIPSLIGAMMAALVGYCFDRGQGSVADFNWHNLGLSAAPDGEIKSAFFNSTYLVLGLMMKCDGRVCEREIEWTRRLMGNMELSEEERQLAIQLFDQGKQQAFEFDKVLRGFGRLCGFSPSLCGVFLRLQLQGALADGKLKKSEWVLLRRAAQCLNFSLVELENMARRYQPHGPVRTVKKNLQEAYKVLGVSSTISTRELKQRYRRLMAKYHPDKAIGEAASEAEVNQAKERTQRIREAYDRIIKVRNSGA